ncbi:MAG: ABC transporter ATP-binding protein [Candidatus Competibacterales bacterium]
MTPVLELQQVTKTYWVRNQFFAPKRPLHALRGVSLHLGPGETLGLVGESGCGKSTLARLLLGLEAPSSGTALLDGESVERHTRRWRARHIQPIFQDPYASLNPRRSVLDTVRQPLEIHGLEVDGRARRARACAMLERVGLPTRTFANYPHQLSGGQRQRVAIARALVLAPRVVVCDEPTSALDVSVQAQILNLLLDLKGELGLSYVFISHNLGVVEYLADRVAVMYLGSIVEEQPAAELFAGPRHPYTEALLASTLTPDPDLAVPEVPLGTVFPNPLNPPMGCHFHPRCPKVLGRCRQQVPQEALLPGGRVSCHLHGDREHVA